MTTQTEGLYSPASSATIFDKHKKSAVLWEEVKTKGGEIVVFVFNDEEPMNPRSDCDNLGTILYSSTKYTLGDKLMSKGLEGFTKFDLCNGEKVVSLPVYAYIHSGICLDTKPFSCPWDSGQSGIIYAKYSDIRKWFGVKNVTNKVKQKAIDCLKGEVETFSQYLSGSVYGFISYDKATGEEINSCWGIYEAPNKIVQGVTNGEY